MRSPVDKAIKRIERRAALVGRRSIDAVRVLLFLLFVASIVLTLEGSVAVSIPLWIWILLAILTAVPNVLQTFDWIWTGGLGRRYQAWLDWLRNEIERRLRRWWLRKLFELHGAEELAEERLPEDEVAYFSVSRRRRLQSLRRLGAGGVLVLVALAFTILQLVGGGSSIHHVAIGREFRIDEIFGITVRGVPSCRKSRWQDLPGLECDVYVLVHNVSHYKAYIFPGSFASIQDLSSELYADYGAALLSNGDYYDLLDAGFNEELLQPGKTTHGKLEFNVTAGVVPDELRIIARGPLGVSVVSFHQ
jgi:hypothetical protein